MSNSTGNSNGQLVTPEIAEMAGTTEPQPPRILVPNLISPFLRWEKADYASLQARLDFYDDFIVLYKFKAGKVTEQYIVDPTEVAAALSGIEISSGLLPANCLFWAKKEGFDRIGIYVPPQIRHVAVRGEKTGWRVPMPGLIFVGHDYNYSIWAVSEPPASTRTVLHLAPCPNIHPGGVCQGNVAFPRAGTTTIWQAVDAFFGSKFNRDLGGGKSKRFGENIIDMWRYLHDSDTLTYPTDDLIAAGLTLGRVLDGSN